MFLLRKIWYLGGKYNQVWLNNVGNSFIHSSFATWILHLDKVAFPEQFQAAKTYDDSKLLSFLMHF